MSEPYDVHTNQEIIESFYDYVTDNSPDDISDILHFIIDLTDLDEDYILSKMEDIYVEREMG